MKKKLYFTVLLFSTLVYGNQVLLSPDKAKTYVKTRIFITDGGMPIIRRSVQNVLTTVIQEINKTTAGIGDFERIRQYCTEKGFLSIRELVISDQIYCIMTEVRTNLIDVPPSGYFEVRNIMVNVGRLSTRQSVVFEYLVFTLDNNGAIADLRYAIEKHQYKRIYDTGRRLPDGSQRKQIIRFVEKYRTAYNTKDLRYLERVFSDNALIIVGLLFQERKQSGDFFEEHSLLGQEEVRLIRRSKRQYLDSLRIKVFEKNSSINVQFSNFEVIQHHAIPYIYGVTLKQDWKSQYYSDWGYLFLMFDFQNTQQPIIYVRSWQPRPFNDGSVVGLYDFEFEAKAH